MFLDSTYKRYHMIFECYISLDTGKSVLVNWISKKKRKEQTNKNRKPLSVLFADFVVQIFPPWLTSTHWIKSGEEMLKINCLELMGACSWSRKNNCDSKKNKLIFTQPFPAHKVLFSHKCSSSSHSILRQVVSLKLKFKEFKWLYPLCIVDNWSRTHALFSEIKFHAIPKYLQIPCP